jgi:hypothetical protein
VQTLAAAGADLDAAAVGTWHGTGRLRCIGRRATTMWR